MLTYLFNFILLLLGVLLFLLILEKFKQTFFKRLCKCKVDLSGKVILITGGNAGLGFVTARTLAKRGARIVIASRNVAKSEAAVRALIEATGNPNIEHKPLDLAKFTSIKQFADDFNKSYDRLDVLINNAGLGEIHRTFTEEGIDTTHQVNHIGPTYLTHLLLDKLVASKPSRIIFVSSNAHIFHNFDLDDIKGKRDGNFWIRYANTKYANILVSKAMSKVFPEGVTVNALHPGMAKTEIWDVGPAACRKVIHFLIDNFMKTTEDCAQTIIHLAMAPALERVTGEYFSQLETLKPFRMVTEDQAQKYYKDTLRLIENNVPSFKS